MSSQKLSREDITKLQREGRRVSTPLFLIYTKENSTKGQRVAVSVSKKEEKTAVGRNRIKRRLRHAVSGVLKDNKKYFDVFCVAKSGVGSVPWKELLRVCENSILKK